MAVLFRKSIIVDMNKRLAVLLAATVLTAGSLFAQAENIRQATEVVPILSASGCASTHARHD